MKIYNYHSASKEYLSESEADLSPLDLKQGKEVWLIPAHATTIKPPPHILKSDVVFNEQEQKWFMKG